MGNPARNSTQSTCLLCERINLLLQAANLALLLPHPVGQLQQAGGTVEGLECRDDCCAYSMLEQVRFKAAKIDARTSAS